jgi:hypothetical protein
MPRRMLADLEECGP